MSFYSVKNISLTLICAALLSACGDDELPLAQGEAPIPDKVDFNFHVKPILSDRCFKCHGPDKNTIEGGLQFNTKEAMFAALGDVKDHYAVVPGDIEKSTFIKTLLDVLVGVIVADKPVISTKLPLVVEKVSVFVVLKTCNTLPVGILAEFNFVSAMLSSYLRYSNCTNGTINTSSLIYEYISCILCFYLQTIS